MRSRRRVRVSGARRVRAVIFCDGLRGLREHNGEVVGDAALSAIIDRATHDQLVGLLDDRQGRLERRRLAHLNLRPVNEIRRPPPTLTPARTDNLGFGGTSLISFFALAYAVAWPLWSDGGDRGVYRTTDGGATWKQVLAISKYTGVNEVVMDPRDPNTLYASAYQRRRHVWTLIDGGPESTIYKSTDGGDNWRKVEKGLPEGDKGRIGLAVSPVDPDVVYAWVEAKRGDSGFFRSANRGESWEKRGSFISTSASGPGIESPSRATILPPTTRAGGTRTQGSGDPSASRVPGSSVATTGSAATIGSVTPRGRSSRREQKTAASDASSAPATSSTSPRKRTLSPRSRSNASAFDAAAVPASRPTTRSVGRAPSSFETTRRHARSSVA